MQHVYNGESARLALVSISTFVLLLAAARGTAQSGGGYDLSWNTIDSGGVMLAVGGVYELSGTIGQPDASAIPMSGGAYTLNGGFWVVSLPACTSFAPADFDRDCDVDGDDFEIFIACVAGPNILYDPDELPPGCPLVPDDDGFIAADFDRDSDVDHDDFGVLQRCYGGPGNQVGPDCAL
jgi:hypothetical protein